MKLSEIVKELERLSNMVGDEFDIPVRINGRLTRTLGRVIAHKRGNVCTNDSMEFSRQFLETSTEESIKKVIAHEWAHYYLTKTTGENHGHDAEFKRVCKMIGCEADQTETTVERTVSEESLYKYIVYCPNCGIVGAYNRMCKTLQYLDECHCSKCGSDKLHYVQNW